MKILKLIPVLFLTASLSLGTFACGSNCKKEEKTRLNIMSYNIFGGKNFFFNDRDYAGHAKVIKDYNADIAGLNEVWNDRDRDGNTPLKKLSAFSGLDCYAFGRTLTTQMGEEYGNGFLSKIPFKKTETIPVPAADEESEPRGLLKAEFVNGLTVIITHFGLTAEEQINSVAAILENLTEEKCVLMGDFNVKPDDAVLAPIREIMTDTADFFKSERMSWPSDKPEMKIDYIFVSRDIKVLSADIPEAAVSDHRPCIAEIEF